MSRSEHRHNPRRRGWTRRVTAVVAGIVLLGSAFQTSFAQGGNQADYDGDGGGGAGVIIAGGVLGAAGIAAALGLFGGAAAGAAAGVFAIGAPHDCRERFPVLPPDHTGPTAWMTWFAGSR